MNSLGRRCAGLLGVLLATGAAVLPAQDAAVQAAAALEQGRPWQATELLRRTVADPRRADPAAVLLAARAAAGWGGWVGVSRLLANQSWPDPESEGLARELLARAALDRRADSEAVGHLRAALSRATTPRQRGIRLTLLARALDRLGQADSAQRHYVSAAGLLPEAAEWLLLRAAALAPDSTTRERLYRRVGTEPARSRAGWTEAAARERSGDLLGAAARFEALGSRLDGLRLRLAAPGSDSARTAARRGLLALVASPLAGEDARAAIALLDQQPPALTPAEQLVVARRATAIGLADRAVRGFAAARAVPGFSDADRLRFGTSLVQLGRQAEALTQFEAVRDRASAGAAAYQRARLLLARSGATMAVPALLAVPSTAPTDTASAGIALFLAGDLLADQGNLRDARELYARVAGEYPTSVHAARALLEVGTLSYLLGDRDRALGVFQDLAERYPEGEEGAAGLYWAGRLDSERGAIAAAEARWRTLIAAAPHSYYALAAARRLGEPAWVPDSVADPAPLPPESATALVRAAMLDTLGLAPEAAFELDYLAARASSDPASLVATAAALGKASRPARALALAQQAFRAGAPRTRNLYQLLFPIPEPATFEALTTARELDPWLTAGLIKQESGFNPRARSAADARGLMQVMPAVGAQLARQLGWPEWDVVLLYQPEVSLTLGTLHLQTMRRQYPDAVRFLAAYNAGGTRVRRWDARPGVLDDPDLYLEMIPYIETRNYVRRVLRNAAFYEGLYGSKQ